MSSDLADIKVEVDPRKAAELRQYLNTFGIEVQDRIIKYALRQYAKDQMAVAASLTPQPWYASKKHLAYRVKFWPSGIAWCGVGYRTIPGIFNFDGIGRTRRLMYDLHGTGWRTHFMELGFHTWGAGLQKPPGARGKGWKRGLYHRGRGIYKRGKAVSLMTAQATSHKVYPYLMREIDFVMKQAATGRRARRNRVQTYFGIGR
jgi:hypothetical protein